MSGAGGRVAMGMTFIAIMAGCRQPAAGSAGVASLPRDGITVAQRAEWRRHLNWPDACEDAFRASHAGDSGAITVTSLEPGGSLVEVTCAAGAYQPSMMRFKVSEGAGGMRAILLSFPVYLSEDGRELTVSNDTEVWGESVVDGDSAAIAILSVARQAADCGVWARYSLTGTEPRLVAAAARLQCPTEPEPAVRLSAVAPPPGWDAIPRKD
jgi:hypothetical protein